MTRIAVVLCNLGGPDGPDAILPFLRNLFRDPAILRVPGPLRWLLAEGIARRRAPAARGIYAQMGGASPILAQCNAQARGLESALSDAGGVRTFIVMRYWHPRAREIAREVHAFAPDQVVLVPLYPQFSTTTTASSVREWERAGGGGVSVGCYAAEPWFVQAYAERIAPLWAEAELHGGARLLFSAHGLPARIAAAGDPYPAQVEASAAAIAAALGLPGGRWRVCYQSRVGPMRWIGPSTENELRRAGADRVPVVVAPVAFTSEHSETLVELDVEGRALATAAGVPAYFRAPAVSDSATFLGGLAEVVRAALAGRLGRCPRDPALLCPAPVCQAPQAA